MVVRRIKQQYTDNFWRRLWESFWVYYWWRARWWVVRRCEQPNPIYIWRKLRWTLRLSRKPERIINRWPKSLWISLYYKSEFWRRKYVQLHYESDRLIKHD